jgi:hypothetical protein
MAGRAAPRDQLVRSALAETCIERDTSGAVAPRGHHESDETRHGRSEPRSCPPAGPVHATAIHGAHSTSGVTDQ